jgi:hypothetical protein
MKSIFYKFSGTVTVTNKDFNTIKVTEIKDHIIRNYISTMGNIKDYIKKSIENQCSENSTINILFKKIIKLPKHEVDYEVFLKKFYREYMYSRSDLLNKLLKRIYYVFKNNDSLINIRNQPNTTDEYASVLTKAIIIPKTMGISTQFYSELKLNSDCVGEEFLVSTDGFGLLVTGYCKDNDEANFIMVQLNDPYLEKQFKSINKIK